VIGEKALDLLRAETTLVHRWSTAPRAGHTDGFRVTTVVTHHAFRRSVHGERNGAVRTVGHVATDAALDECRKPAPVEQQDGLLAAGDLLASARSNRRLNSAERIDRHGATLDAHMTTGRAAGAASDPFRQGESIGIALGILRRSDGVADPARRYRLRPGA
jgi:hypothetical protein